MYRTTTTTTTTTATTNAKGNENLEMPLLSKHTLFLLK
jgi:hypothetical protein